MNKTGIVNVKVTSPGELDHREAKVRFQAKINGRNTQVAITTYALFIISEALEMSPAEPLTIYAASGRLLEKIVANAVEAVGEGQPLYFVTEENVLRVTGRSGIGNEDVPRRWQG